MERWVSLLGLGVMVLLAWLMSENRRKLNVRLIVNGILLQFGMAAYAGMGADAGHLLAASLMSAPAALVVAKIMVPEVEQSPTKGMVRVEVPKTDVTAPPLAVAPFDAAAAKAHQQAWAKHLGQPVEMTNSIGMKPEPR